MIRIGTSGFSYPEWKGTFYPTDVPAKKYLAYYASHFPTTEINNSFYRTPNVKTIETWREEVPENFSFTLKLNQNITHRKKLKGVTEDMDYFLEVASHLHQKLGTILVQLPPYFKKDTATLDEFASGYSQKARLAFEFRHATWNDTEVYDILRKHKCAWAVVEAEDQEAIREITADFVYMRLRKGDYTLDELQQWGDWIKKQTVDVYCYLKHDEKAPVLAKQLMEALI